MQLRGRAESRASSNGGERAQPCLPCQLTDEWRSMDRFPFFPPSRGKREQLVYINKVSAFQGSS